ncbi:MULTISPECIES: helix-hairpin-helix domain-containing protein [Prevotellaceae]|uniref:helix-hairpin-helix domain-containing protein n=1 Tax=Prevotellaceae TaxID=171552 RepID=UPI0003D37220|nr:helix-hairpin-helix domain-containing protein [Prevotella phocaeensis]ETD18517.1 hypothetical protein HMPREF1199_01333 [Hoylesella oralis CC98A]
MYRQLLLAGFFICSFAAFAQNKPDWETYYEQLTGLEDAEDASWEDVYDILSDLAEHKINLNTATREDLGRLIFLTDEQVEELSEYLYKYGPMRSLGELSMVESLDEPRRKLLACFVYLGEERRQDFPSLANILKYGGNELAASVRLPLYERRGDRNGYLGYRYKHSFRYSYSYGQSMKFGVVGAQDAGEQFFSGRNSWGYDYYSFYLMLRDWGRIRAFVAGRYRLKFGMGLIMNTDYGFGKAAILATLGRTSNSVRAHSSRSEGNYLQGVAATVGIFRGLDLTAFVSYRDIDATLTKDSSGIATIVKTGYHRTVSEMNRKHNATETLFGANMRYFRNGFHVGVTALNVGFNKPLCPDTRRIYQRYRPSGSRFWNIGADYGYASGKLSFNGEIATGDCHALATVNSLSFRLTSSLSLMALQRFYSYRYYSLFSRSFSDGGSVQGESGAYIGADWQVCRHLRLSAYTDYAYFPWARYRVSKASWSWDHLLSAVYQRRNITVTARYRLRNRQQDNDTHTLLIGKTEHRTRLSVAFEDGAHWQCKTQIDGVCCRCVHNSTGLMVTQNIGYRCHWLTLNGSFGYFNTDDYDSRVYSYEWSPRYNFAFPVFFGEGIRYMLMAHAALSAKLHLYCKVGTTDYFDRNHISSSYQQIDRSSQTDVDMQVIWRF